MQVSAFEYTDQSFTYKLLGMSLLGFAVVVFTAGFTAPLIGSGGVMFAAFMTGILIFAFNKKKIKQKGSVIITDSYAEFTFAKVSKRINYSEIGKYQFERFNVVRLYFRMKNGEKFLVVANHKFCKTEQLEIVSRALDQVLINYEERNHGTLQRQRDAVEIVSGIFMGAKK